MKNRTPADALDTAFEELGKRKEDALGDSRYRKPKQEPKAKNEEIDQTIDNNDIYRRVRNFILKEKRRMEIAAYGTQDYIQIEKASDVLLSSQRKQIAYGIDKYPESLNASSWSMIESMRHILDETIDKIHYLKMLHIQLEKQVTGVNHDLDGLIAEVEGVLTDSIQQAYQLAILQVHLQENVEVTLQEEAEKLLNTAINNGHL